MHLLGQVQVVDVSWSDVSGELAPRESSLRVEVVPSQTNRRPLFFTKKKKIFESDKACRLFFLPVELWLAA